MYRCIDVYIYICGWYISSSVDLFSSAIALAPFFGNVLNVLNVLNSSRVAGGLAGCGGWRFGLRQFCNALKCLNVSNV